MLKGISQIPATFSWYKFVGKTVDSTFQSTLCLFLSVMQEYIHDNGSKTTVLYKIIYYDAII